MRSLRWLTVTPWLIGCASMATPASTQVGETSAAITPEDLRRRVNIIADDSMMGRETGSLGDYKTAEYVAAEYKRLGLEPAGENGTYFQTVPMWNAAIDPTSYLEVAGRRLELGRDFVPASLAATPRVLSGTGVIYGGLVTDTAHWISADAAVGKIVVIGIPEGGVMRGLPFSPQRFRGAVALAVPSLANIGAEQIARLREGRPVADTARAAAMIPVIWLSQGSVSALLGGDHDASGTASILEIAEAMSRSAQRPRRSILFVSHTGEEAGLLGSRWYTDHATVPVDSIVAEIDQDQVGRGTSSDFPRNGTGAGSVTYLEVVGAKRLSREFGDTLEAANRRQPVPFEFDYTYDTPGHPLQYYCRADHYNYGRYGIPALAISRGEHLDYHQVTDEAQYLSYDDMARVSRMVFTAATAIANMSHRPVLSIAKPADPHGQCRQ